MKGVRSGASHDIRDQCNRDTVRLDFRKVSGRSHPLQCKLARYPIAVNAGGPQAIRASRRRMSSWPQAITALWFQVKTGRSSGADRRIHGLVTSIVQS